MVLVFALIMLLIGLVLYKHKQNFKAEGVAFFAVALVCVVSSVKVTFMYHDAGKTLKEDSIRVILTHPDTLKTSQIDIYSIYECQHSYAGHYGNCIKCSQ